MYESDVNPQAAIARDVGNAWVRHICFVRDLYALQAFGLVGAARNQLE